MNVMFQFPKPNNVKTKQKIIQLLSNFHEELTTIIRETYIRATSTIKSIRRWNVIPMWSIIDWLVVSAMTRS